jgi:hypothetical protein
MTTMRKGETKPQTRVRESRFFHSMEQWYFLTREGFVEGPFEDPDQAQKMLETYLDGLKKKLN